VPDKTAVIKNMVWNAAGTSVYFMCQWLITVFAVKLSDGYADAGNLALAMNITNFFICIAVNNIRTYQVSDINAEFSTGVYFTSRIITCLFSIGLCVIFTMCARYSVMQQLVIMGYMLFRAFEALSDFFYGIAQKSWRMDYIGISFTLRGILMLLIFVVLKLAFGLLAAVYGMFFSNFLVCIFFDFVNAKKLEKFSCEFNWSSIRSLLGICFPLMVISLIIVFVVSYSRYSIEKIYGTELLGVYASVAAPTVIIQAVSAFVFTPFVNVFTYHLKEKNMLKFLVVFSVCGAFIFGFTIIGLLVAHVFGEWGLSLLFGRSIKPYAYLLPGVIICAGLTVFIWYMNMIFSILRDIKNILIGNSIGLVICIFATNTLLVKYGLLGANYVLVFGEGITVIYLLIIFFYSCKTKYFRYEKTGACNAIN